MNSDRVAGGEPQPSGDTPRRVLVTGPDGFIGAQVMSALARLSSRVRPIALDANCDIRDAQAVDHYLRQVRPDVVLHLAAVSGAMLFPDQPDIVVATNTVGTLNVLHAAHRAGVSRVFYASSVATFECPPGSSQPPRSLYGATKAFGETLATLYRRRGLTVCSLRIGAVYGPQRVTSDTVGDMIHEGRADHVIHYDPCGVEPLIEVRDAARLLAAATLLDQPREGYDVVGYVVTHRQLAEAIADRLGCRAVAGNESTTSAWQRPFNTWALLEDTGLSIAVGLEEGIAHCVTLRNPSGSGHDSPGAIESASS